ncbi:lens fiber membrane intrinsic protein-like [Hydractinia symbiolongicarpus]|uniref:lens fiber membrane intrinsic protein-like n=1 Tax=Hydractinia symbiolongicarpus TaxID=13093 RepID=UPI00254C3A7D|nr:lens fiber membrane intrinsic protein-like [Hydractinia symbiolongicarpus]
MDDIKILKIVIIFVGFLVFLFSAISLGSDHWLEDKSGDHVHGLWERCYNGKCHELKDNKQEVPDYLEESRVMMLFGCFFSILAVIVFVLNFLRHEKLACILACVVCAITAIFTIAGLAVFYEETEEAHDLYDMKYGWSIALGWVSVVFALIALILTVVVMIKAEKQVVHVVERF